MREVVLVLEVDEAVEAALPRAVVFVLRDTGAVAPADDQHEQLGEVDLGERSSFVFPGRLPKYSMPRCSTICMRRRARSTASRSVRRSSQVELTKMRNMRNYRSSSAAPARSLRSPARAGTRVIMLRS